MDEKYKELITSTGNLNSSLISSKKFIESSLCKNLINDTSELNIFSDITINERASFLIHNFKLSYCKVCNKPYMEI